MTTARIFLTCPIFHREPLRLHSVSFEHSFLFNSIEPLDTKSGGEEGITVLKDRGPS